MFKIVISKSWMSGDTAETTCHDINEAVETIYNSGYPMLCAEPTGEKFDLWRKLVGLSFHPNTPNKKDIRNFLEKCNQSGATEFFCYFPRAFT